MLDSQGTKRRYDDDDDGKEDSGGGEVKDRVVVYSPMFNSGAFKVPWERTEALIIEIFEGWDNEWILLAPP